VIDSFEIRVPSVVETEGDFVVEVRALDAQGAIVTSDSTTVVELTSSDPNIVFDGNEDGTYGQVGDNQKTLTNGIAFFSARDIKSGTFTVNVEDTQANTGSAEFIYSFNCLILPDRQTEPPAGTPTLESNQFFRPRDLVTSVEEDPALYEVRVSSVTPVSGFQTLPVTLLDSLEFNASSIAQGNGTTVETLPNDDGDVSPTQAIVASRATFNTNQINGSPVLTFDGDDFYDLENSTTPLITETSDFTVVAAVRLLQSGGVQTIFSQYEEAADNGKLLFRYDGGFEILAGNDGSLADLSVKTVAQTINVPHLVFFERRSNTYSIEVDGTQLASTPDGGTRQILQTGNIIGARSSSGAYNDNLTDFYPSDLLALKVIPGALSVEQKITETYAYEDSYGDPTANSTAYISSIQSTYNFDAIYPHDDPPQGFILRDVSGNGRNGTFRGTPEQAPLLTDGGSSIEYGPDQISLLTNFSLPSSANRTYHFWVATNEAVGNSVNDRYLFDHETPRIALFWEIVNNAPFAGEVGIFDTTYRGFGVSLPRGDVTTLVSFVFTGTSCELFFNGVSQGSIACDSQGALTASATTLGSRFSASLGGEGTITYDAVMIINAAQAPADILAIYNAGVA
jgi:hypothetical protein